MSRALPSRLNRNTHDLLPLGDHLQIEAGAVCNIVALRLRLPVKQVSSWGTAAMLIGGP